jgi:hypothetical protein
MATTMHEMHDMLGTIVKKATTMAAALQKIHDEQQDCPYKLEVMAGIRSTDAQPLPLPCTPQPAVWLEPPPPEAAGVAEIGNVQATSYGPEPRPASPPASLTAGVVSICGPKLPPTPPLSTLTGTATTCRTKPRPASPHATPTIAAITICRPNTGPASLSSTPPVATTITECDSDWIGNNATVAQNIESEYEPLFPSSARLLNDGSARIFKLGPTRLASTTMATCHYGSVARDAAKGAAHARATVGQGSRAATVGPTTPAEATCIEESCAKGA